MKDRFVNIQEWMLQFGLKPSELIAFAIVFGFSQDGKSTFKGGLDYICSWLGTSKNTACATMNALVEKKLIDKIEHTTGSIKVCEYRVSKILRRTKNLDGSRTKNLYGTIQKTCMKKETKENKETKEPIANNSLNDIMSRYGS